MKAARIHEYGGPEVFKIEEIERPPCGAKDLLVEVKATSINPVDWKIRKGTQRAVVRKKMPTILGMDVSGVVIEAGPEVKGFKVGDEVFCSPTHRRPGTYAEYVALDFREVALKPPRLSHAEAASIPLVGLTAWDCLVRSAKVKKGERVFIEAGSGGVGSFAIQLAKHLGATVATTCSARNEALVRDLGADVVVDYTQSSFDEVLDPQDVVLEAMGGESKQKSLAILRRGGRLTSINSDMVPLVKKYGAYFGVLAVALSMIRFKIGASLRHGIKFSPVVRKADGEALAKIAAIIEEGAIRPVIDREFTLDQIADAHRYSQSGRARGKIVVVV